MRIRGSRFGHNCLKCALVFSIFLISGKHGPARGELAQNPKLAEIVSRISAENLRRHVDTLAGFHSRHVASENIHEAWEYIRSEFAKNPRLQVELDEFEEQVARANQQRLRLVNVVATLPGRRDPDRYYVVGGHYDSRASRSADAQSRAPGAVDDASGTAVVLELARLMSAYEFDATLVFIAFTAEEMGLIGSRHWAQGAREKGLEVDAMITNDIVGNTGGGGELFGNSVMRVFSEGVRPAEAEEQARLRARIGGENDSPARQLARYVKEVGERYVPNFEVELIFRVDRLGRGGDHISFSRAGYPAVRFSEKYENYRRQHQDVRVENGIQYGDLPEFFDADYCAQIARVNAAVLASLADAPPPPRNVGILGAQRYDTTLTWDPVVSHDLAGYQIVVRQTTAPYWQKKIFVGDVNQYTMEGTLADDFFFAVQAVDRDGNTSRPIFPTRSGATR